MFHGRDADVRQLFNIRQIFLFLKVAEAYGHARVPRAPRAPDPVHICLGDIGQIIVEHMGKAADVNAAGGNVRGHQHADTAVLEAAQRVLPGVLAFVAVDGHSPDARAGKLPHNAVRPMLGAGEHQRAGHLRFLQQLRQQVALVALVHKINALLNALHRRGGRRDHHLFRAVEQAVGQLLDLPRHGGREQQRLLLPRKAGEHPLHIMYKAHVQHAVGFVQYEYLNIFQVDIALSDEIVQAAGRGCQDIYALFQPGHLGILVHAAENNAVCKAHMAAVSRKAFVDLQRKLAGRRENERSDGTPARRCWRSRQTLQNGHGERGGLAGSGLSAAQQVPPGQYGRNGFLLNGRRFFVARLGGGFQNWGNQVQIAEFHAVGSNLSLSRDAHTFCPGQ